MTIDKILSVALMYKRMFEDKGVRAERLDIKVRYESMTQRQMLSHAHYLTEGLIEYAQDPEKIGKANRHLGNIQNMLLCAGVFSIEDLMNHNRPDES